MAFGIGIFEWWVSLLGGVLTVAYIGIGLSLMVQVLKLGDAAKYLAVFTGLTGVLILIPLVAYDLWSAMSIWQRFVLAIVVVIIWSKRHSHQRQPRRQEER